MPTKVPNPLSPTTVRFAAAELEEIDEFVARAGVRRSDFLRSAVLSRLREADAFSNSVPDSIDQIDLRIARLHELVSQQSALIRTLVGASIAHVAGTVDYGSTPTAEVNRQIDAAIMHALKAGPAVVEACIQQHPDLQASDQDSARRAE